MENIKEIIQAVCIISAAICIIDGLASGTRLKNQMKFLLNLVFITAITAPLVKGTLTFEMPDISKYMLNDNSEAEQMYSDELCLQTGRNISSVLLQQLEAAGISCDEIETNINISETNSISISNVTVCADDFEAASRLIKNSLGEDTEVLNGNL